jgi:hypothetical protein
MSRKANRSIQLACLALIIPLVLACGGQGTGTSSKPSFKVGDVVTFKAAGAEDGLVDVWKDLRSIGKAEDLLEDGRKAPTNSEKRKVEVRMGALLAVASSKIPYDSSGRVLAVERGVHGDSFCEIEITGGPFKGQVIWAFDWQLESAAADAKSVGSKKPEGK